MAISRALMRIVGVAAITVGFSGIAAAEDKETARRHFESGVMLLKAEDFDAAAHELALSVAYFANNNNIYNLANCYRALHRYGEALVLFERLLSDYDEKLSTEMRRDIERQIVDINAIVARVTVESNIEGAVVTVDGKAVGKTPLVEPLVLAPGKRVFEAVVMDRNSVSQILELSAGTETKSVLMFAPPKSTLTVNVGTKGAEVFIDGESIGLSPLSHPVILGEGASALRVVKDGFEPFEQTLSFSAGETKTLNIELTPLPVKPAVVTATREVFPVAAGKKGPMYSPVFITGVSGTAAFGILSAAMWGLTLKNKNQYIEKNDQLRNEWDEAVAGERRDARDNTERFNKIAIVSTVATGAFAALTVVGLTILGEKNRDASIAVSSCAGGMCVRF